MPPKTSWVGGPAVRGAWWKALAVWLVSAACKNLTEQYMFSYYKRPHTVFKIIMNFIQ